MATKTRARDEIICILDYSDGEDYNAIRGQQMSLADSCTNWRDGSLLVWLGGLTLDFWRRKLAANSCLRLNECR
jgi:hypothetical protein